MTPKDWLRAICVIFIWGINFVVIKIGVTDLPPFLLAALRFTLIALPAIFFVKPPKTKLSLLFFYGMTISFGQFALLFLAMRLGMPAGIASLVVQTQAFFTAILGVFLGEKLRTYPVAGFIVAGMGMFLVGTGSGTTLAGAPGITLLTMMLTLLAALCWGLGNIANKLIMQDKRGAVNGLSLVVWSAVIPIIPFYVCSFIFDGPAAIASSLHHFHISTFFVLVYLAFISSFIGFVFWSDLLSRYESWRVAPLTLIVPVIGMISSAIIFHEKMTHQQMVGAMVVLFGLLINIFGKRLLSLFFPIALPRKNKR